MMPFGLSDAGSTFPRMVNSIFADLISDGTVLVYLDDILVGKHVPPDGTGCKIQRTGSPQNRPRSVPNRSEGQKCKYAEKSYKYKYDLGHSFHNVVVIKVVEQL